MFKLLNKIPEEWLLYALAVLVTVGAAGIVFQLVQIIRYPIV
jgi:hypothetical protein